MSGFNEANTIEKAIGNRLSALPGLKWTLVRGAEKYTIRWWSLVHHVNLSAIF